MVQKREGTKEKKAKLCKESQSGRVVKTNGLPFLLFFFFLVLSGRTGPGG